ncbi:hypothetical protein IWQ60_005556 [Tieghemiomyces parasiticus]|uniref:Uncharacterized protein n=1 Tax=Tieghemiomyces parasiticus TaxID=78921 RepID=A0A9W8DSY7_9FUNG|nr:hypothetical protein IWQ60_005556 [Tieghemiomyces parasiticus]
MTTQPRFAPRPSLGTTGTKVNVEANFYELGAFTTGKIYQYDFQVDGKVPPALYRDIFRAVDKYHGPTLFKGDHPVFDGHAQVYSASRLAISDRVPFDVYLEEDYAHHQVAPSGGGPKPFQVTFKFATTVNMQELRDFIDGKHKDLDRITSCLNALDLAFHQHPASQHVSAKNSFYTPEGVRPLSGGIEVWSGLFQSVRPASGRLLLNVDVSSCAFYTPGSLLDRALQYIGLRRPEDLQLGPRSPQYRALRKALKGVPITITHREDNRRYKIRDVQSEGANRSMFQMTKDDGTKEKVSVADYFQRTLNISLLYPYLPCVEVKRGVLLPLEVCTVASGVRYTRKLTPVQTAEMIKFTCIRPHDRFNRIRNNAPQLINFNNSCLKAFGIRVNPRILVIPARTLAPPSVVRASSALRSYGILVLDRHHPRMVAALSSAINELFRACGQVGMQLTDKRAQPVFASLPSNLQQGLRNAWNEGHKACGAAPQVVFVILPSTDAQVYGEVKRISDTVMGAPTQCLQSGKLQKGGIQYMANVALKLNVKLRGVNCQLRPGQVPFLTSNPTMVVGADVTHPEPGSVGQNSIAAIVATLDSSYARFTSRVDHQTPGTEMIANMEAMFFSLLRTFETSSKRLTSCILFYRDGVSDSQFSTVLDFEVAAIHRACAKAKVGYAPRTTFVTCQKRHHVRFRPVNRQDEERSGNCRAGTVVDTHITNPALFDFYLQAHSGLQGTSRPVHYTVLLDENRLTADVLQDMTNRLCYAFPRCARTVSLCTPAYMADVLAARARYHKPASLFIDDTSSQASGESALTPVYASVPFKPALYDTLFYM